MGLIGVNGPSIGTVGPLLLCACSSRRVQTGLFELCK